MSFEFESFRPRKYMRSRFLDGDYLLSQEASDIELEVLEYARTIVQNMLGDIALNDAWLTQAVPSSLGIPNYQKKLILRPGTAYYNGLLYRMESGLDPKVAASASQPVTLGSPNDPGGKIVDFTGLASGYYKMIVQGMEEAVNASEDTFLQGAAVPETTAQKRRLNYTILPVPSDVYGNISGLDPLNFANTSGLTSQQRTNFFSYNDVFQVPVTANTIVPTTDTLGSTAVVTFSNDNGGGTIFPTGPLMGQIFTDGFLVDPDGTYFYITFVSVSTSPDQVSFTISQELAVPAGSGLQPNPNLSTLGLKYTLIPKDVVNANPSTGIPIGTRNYAVANTYWNGTDFSSSPFGFSSSEGVVNYNIVDLRRSATQQNIEAVADKENWVLTGGGTVQWFYDAGHNNGTLYWSSAFLIEQPTSPSLVYQINAGNTFALFGTTFAEDEVLYFVIPPDPSGTVIVTLQKDAKGTGDLARYQPEEIVILAYRKNNQIYSTHSGLTLVVPAYDERILYPSGLPANTPITLPNNSRNNNMAETYDPNLGLLQIFQNKQMQFQDNSMGADWYSPGMSDTQIAFTFALPNDCEIHFRMESVNGWSTGTSGGGSGVTSLNSLTGNLNLISSDSSVTITPSGFTIDLQATGGGGGTLQSAYNAGNTITTSPSTPFTVTSGGGKAAQFNGDIGVTGIIDPSALELTPQSSNPMPGSTAGIWAASNGQLMITDGTTPINVAQSIINLQMGVGVTTLTESLLNNTGSTIPAGRAVCTSTSTAGEIRLADPSPTPSDPSASARVIGITLAAIPTGTSGLVAISGVAVGVITGLAQGSYAYLSSTPGVLVPTSALPAGYDVVKVGVVDGHNLALQIENIGTM